VSGRVVLLGHGIGYSASPAMHNAAFASTGLDLVYELRDVPPSGLAAAVAGLRGELGANVTQPHKVAALGLVDELDADAARIGALNTIVQRDGRLIGYDTDLAAIAAELSLLCAEPPGSAVVLGAGGASRAVVAALAGSGAAEVVVVTRAEWHRLPTLLAGAQLLVNATPIGTGSDESPIGAELLRSDLAVLDLVYRPSPTRLVLDARSVGAPAADGSGVLLRQAALSFTLWTGMPAPTQQMRAALVAELAQ